MLYPKFMRFLLCMVILCGLILSSYSAETRAAWLIRYEATTESDIQDAVDYMAAHHLNTLMIQVYGDSYALYDSSFVPHSYLVDPNFDALEAAVRIGHANGIKVHAYMNTLNVYKGSLSAPTDQTHIINSNPEWAMKDAAGTSMINNIGVSGTYVFYSPANSGFKNYLVDVAEEIVTNYAVDGVQMDYIRFPATNYGYCDASKDGFYAQYGFYPQADDPEWDQYRRDLVTNLVQSVSDAVHTIDADCQVSASTWHSNGAYFQDTFTWLEAGYLDQVFPMTYTDSMTRYNQWIEEYHKYSGGRNIVPAIMVTDHYVDDQIQACRDLGLEGSILYTVATVNAADTADVDTKYTSATSPYPMPWLDGSTDTDAPYFCEIGAVRITSDSALIRWHSDEKADSYVDYGTTVSYGLNASDSLDVFDHSVQLSGLSASTTYHFRVKSTDLAGNDTISGDFSFTTPASGSVADIIIDQDETGFDRKGLWYYADGAGSAAYNGDYYYTADATVANSFCSWRPSIAVSGSYQVYAMYRSSANRCTNAPYRIFSYDGDQTVQVDQTANGGVWYSLGTFTFQAGDSGYIQLSNQASGGDVVIADAIKLVYQPDTTPPAVPSGLSASAADNAVNLSWNANTEADFDHYNLYRSTSSGGPYSLIASPMNAQYSDYGLSAGTTYYYVIASEDESGNISSQSAQVYATPTASTTHFLVENFENWTPSTAVMLREPAWSGSSYGVNSSTDSAAVSSSSANNILDPAVDSTGSQSNRIYFQWTTAGSGFVRCSTYQMTNKPNPILDFSKGLSLYVKVSQGTVDMTYWVRETGSTAAIGENGGVSGAIEKCTNLKRLNSSDQWQYVYWNLPSESYNAVTGNGVLEGAKGTLEAICFQAVSGSADTTIEIFVDDIYQGPQHTANTSPDAPAGLSSSVDSNQVILDWSDHTASDFASYTVYRSLSSGTGYSALASGLTSSEYIDNSVSNGTTYYYVVTAVDTASLESEYSSEISAVPAVQELILDNADSGFTASSNWWASSWSSQKYATTYHVRSNEAISDSAVFNGTLPASGTYKVYGWWTDGTSRSNSVPYLIYHDGGSSTVRVNQQINGGQWNLIGTYTFTASSNVDLVKVSCWTSAAGYIIADAVRFEKQ